MSGKNMERGEASPTRYWPGPPIPENPYVPSLMAHAEKLAFARVSERWDGGEDTLHSTPGYLWGIDLYNHHCYWEAHEEWEQLWKAARPASTPRYFLQGLIQCAAASLKGAHGQWGPCLTLGTKGLAKLLKVLETHGDQYQDLDVRRYSDNFREYCSAMSVTEEPPKILLARNLPREKVR